MSRSSILRLNAQAVPSHPAARPSARAGAGWLGLGPLLWSLALTALFAQVVVYLAHAATILPYPFDLDQGEGYDVNAGRLIAQGRPIYTDNASFPYFSSNYPPLYSILVALAIQVWGPALLAGRAISLAASLALGGLIFWAARARGNTVGGLVAAGFFWLSNYVFHVTPLARVNAVTALLALAGLVCLERDGPRRQALGAGLLLAALFTKPTAVDAVAAALLFLWSVGRRRQALRVGAALALAGLGLTALLEVGTGRAYSLNVFLGNVNPFIPAQLLDYLLNFAVLHAVPLGLALGAVVISARERRPDPLIFFLASGLVMALGVGKWGAGESYFLSAIVAASILGGSLAGRLALANRRLASLVPALILVQCAISAHGAPTGLLPALRDRGLQATALGTAPTYADLERGSGIVWRLQHEAGDALSEDPGFLVAAGREVVGNATHLRNLHQAGRWDPERLVADIESRRYHTVVLDAELYPEPVLAAIGRCYYLYDTAAVYRATQKVFVPGAS